MRFPLADPHHVYVSVVPFVAQLVLLIQVFFPCFLVVGRILASPDCFRVKLWRRLFGFNQNIVMLLVEKSLRT